MTPPAVPRPRVCRQLARGAHTAELGAPTPAPSRAVSSRSLRATLDTRPHILCCDLCAVIRSRGASRSDARYRTAPRQPQVPHVTQCGSASSRRAQSCRHAVGARMPTAPHCAPTMGLSGALRRPLSTCTSLRALDVRVARQVCLCERCVQRSAVAGYETGQACAARGRECVRPRSEVEACRNGEKDRPRSCRI